MGKESDGLIGCKVMNSTCWMREEVKGGGEKI
jgi:hypothetical protein